MNFYFLRQKQKEKCPRRIDYFTRNVILIFSLLFCGIKQDQYFLTKHGLSVFNVSTFVFAFLFISNTCAKVDLKSTADQYSCIQVYLASRIYSFFFFFVFYFTAIGLNSTWMLSTFFFVCFVLFYLFFSCDKIVFKYSNRITIF